MSDSLAEVFEARFARRPSHMVRAPGRVNLIGEHTDYNDGFVLPMAIDRYVELAFSANGTSRIRGFASDFDDERTASLEALAPPGELRSWFDYATGLAWVLRDEGVSVQGMDFTVRGDLPQGAGLSSSAALEVAVARAVHHVSDEPFEPTVAARRGQRVENDYIGLASGIMDQMASAASRAGCAMLLDCRSLEIEHVPLPDDLAVVVMDSGTRRSVAESAYNERRASCERAVEVLRGGQPGLTALRDVSLALLESVNGRLDPTSFRRALHVVHENERTLAMARALTAGDRKAIGELMAGSHRSLRDLYEVSSEALDAVVALATQHPACFGARMTGAGFGGSAVALVDRNEVARFVRDVSAAYQKGAVFACRAVSGVELTAV